MTDPTQHPLPDVGEGEVDPIPRDYRREAKLRKAAEDVLEFETGINRSGDAGAMEDYEGAMDDLRTALAEQGEEAGHE